MRQRHQIISFLLLVIGATSVSAQDGERATAAFLDLYYHADIMLRASSAEYRATEAHQLRPKIELVNRASEPLTYSVDGLLLLHAWAEGPRIRMVLNRPLSRRLQGTEPIQAIPRLGFKEAIESVHRYLDQFGVSVKDDLELTTCAFNRNYRSAWELRWTRVQKGYPWDNFLESELESVVVVFHEVEGLVLIGNAIFTPPPKSFDVQISREDAIAKACRYVPLVQRTRFYQEARRDGFVANELRSCDLKIAVPNWLLDPMRAVWIREKPALETRLCWVVRFTTVDGNAEARNLKSKDGKPLKLIAPDVLIYLDAASGEVVGANFT